ncbi:MULTISPECIES: lipocalin-like domain-containing protein [Synechococcales]|uniref:lipocalin-like domain-containing protein n=1 Tax=unclassified Synechococcus TaxID=2626047 RepID=UPI0021A3C5E9|nr:MULTISPECIES: lipocalin-like domain-containing protein [unclassified Synechococcus]MCT0213314.1 lipocalin-like domain-containing protein [Synechococcus sp. CS-1326]MCT0232832.1 lipocalin-like domain-containing protein [Synechococcus sp. CS-1327]
MKADDLVGSWRLRSWRNVGNDGVGVDPLGEHPVGFIFYNHDGYMSVEIMASHRSPYHNPDVFGGTPAERSDAISSYLSYSGPFEVLEDQDAVVHHIEVCSYPNWIGNAQVRFAKLDGDVLVLSTKPMLFQGVERRAELVWERIGHD